MGAKDFPGLADCSGTTQGRQASADEAFALEFVAPPY